MKNKVYFEWLQCVWAMGKGINRTHAAAHDNGAMTAWDIIYLFVSSL